MRFAVVYLKGGVGKTTTAVHVAAHLARQASTLLIDGDPQESGATWAAWRRDRPELPAPTTVRLRGKAVFDEGREMQSAFAHTVVDAGGRDGAGLRNAMLLAEKIIVPIGNSGLDAAVLDEFMELVTTAQDFNRDLKVRLLLNRIDTRTSTKELESFLSERNIHRFNQVIGERRIFPKAISQGLTIEEFKPKNAAATHDMKKFYQELEDWK